MGAADALSAPLPVVTRHVRGKRKPLSWYRHGFAEWLFLENMQSPIWVFIGDFNGPLSVIDRIHREKINKDIENLNHTINHLHLIDIYRTFHLPKQNTYFSQWSFLMEYSE